MTRLLLPLLLLAAHAPAMRAQPFEQPSPNVPANVQGLSPAITVTFGTNKWADYNGDGNWDFLLLGRLPPTTTNTVPLFGDVFRGSPTISLNPPGLAYAFFIVRTLERLWLSDADWDDFDRDGDLDLITIGASAIDPPLNPRTIVYESAGNGINAISTAIPGVHSGSVRWGDFDNDGDPDIAVLGIDQSGSHSTSLFRNDGGGAFTSIALPVPGIAYGALEWLDFDSDGDLDLFAIGVQQDGTVYAGLHRNDSGVFADSGQQFRGLAFATVAVGDFDSDADIDILVTGQRHSAKFGSGTSMLFRNDAGSFTEIPTTLPNLYYGDALWADYDRDGDLDIIMSGRRETFGSNVLQACVQGPPAAFTCNQLQTAGLGGQPAPGLAYGSVAVVDYDVDNVLDIMVSGLQNNAQQFTTLYRSVSPALNTRPVAPDGLSAVVGQGTVALSWNRSLDPNTPSAGLTYELRVGTTTGGVEVVAPRANPQTGFRRVVGMGSVGSGTSWNLVGLQPGTYYWSVQAVDNSYAGSPFAAEHTFTIGS